MEEKYSMPTETFEKIDAEVHRAIGLHGPCFHSLHECYAVIAEELDELWDHVRMRKNERDLHRIEKELIQIAAMAIKGMNSLSNFTGSQKEQLDPKPREQE